MKNNENENKNKNETTPKNINCFFCNRKYIDNKVEFSNCKHKMCDLCIFERIFIHHISELQGQEILKISCKCEESFSDLTLTQILNILKNKRKFDLTKVISTGFENIENTKEGCECSKTEDNESKKLFSDYFCGDCFKWICKNCRYNINNYHYKHRLFNSRQLIKYLKDNIKKLFLKIPSVEIFEKRWEELSEKFKTAFDENFNQTLAKMDDLIKTINNLKKSYVEQYEIKIKNLIKTFKILKIFYMNYYGDKMAELKKQNVETNDIFKLKYISDISYEFIGFEMNHSMELENEISKIKNDISQTKISNMKLIEGNFIFDKVPKNYSLDEILVGHTKFITSLIYMNNKIISGSTDFSMRVWDNETGSYVVKQSLKTKKRILTLLGLKNGKICLAAVQTNDIFIYELNEKEEYYNSQSLSFHDKWVSALIELEDEKIVSSSIDGKIAIWLLDTKSNQYNVYQSIDTKNPIFVMTALDDFKFAYTGDNGIISIIGAKTQKLEEKVISEEFDIICSMEKQNMKVLCICKLNNGYFASAGSSKNGYNIYIWKPSEKKYILGQIIKDAHKADINSLILLRSGNFASSSKDRTIKIWSINKPIKDKVEYITIEELTHYGHGLYKLIQLKDDRLVSSATDNNLVFWRNTNCII